jgi:hypothetical protein
MTPGARLAETTNLVWIEEDPRLRPRTWTRLPPGPGKGPTVTASRRRRPGPGWRLPGWA